METTIGSICNEWIKKMWYTYVRKYYSAIRKKEILPFAITWRDLEVIMLGEKSQRKTNAIFYDTTYMWNLKKPNS